MNLQPPHKLFTIETANRLLPTVRAKLKTLRTTHREILSLQGLIDIEELAGSSGGQSLSPDARRNITELNEKLIGKMDAFEEELEEFHALGCELKDLGQGLVDFFTLRAGELAYLCWREDEPEIKYWHPLEGGFTAREPL